MYAMVSTSTLQSYSFGCVIICVCIHVSFLGLYCCSCCSVVFGSWLYLLLLSLALRFVSIFMNVCWFVFAVFCLIISCQCATV